MKRRRLIAALCLLAAAAPGTFVRTPLPVETSGLLEVRAAVRETAAMLPEGLTVDGVWSIDGAGRGFGGFSALLWDGNRLLAFTDRGDRLSFDPPDTPGARFAISRVTPHPDYRPGLLDIESAVRDDAGNLWLGFENGHAVHRFDAAGTPTGFRSLDEEISLLANAGIEAMVRLPDGTFALFPEWRDAVYRFDGDPTDGATFTAQDMTLPLPDYGVTDAALLPDGRVLMLLRDVSYTIPPTFGSALAIGRLPDAGADEAFAPELLVELHTIVPQENYEGLAIRLGDDGAIAIWIISDDNFSVFQRTLMVRLTYRP